MNTQINCAKMKYGRAESLASETWAVCTTQHGTEATKRWCSAEVGGGRLLSFSKLLWGNGRKDMVVLLCGAADADGNVVLTKWFKQLEENRNFS